MRSLPLAHVLGGRILSIYFFFTFKGKCTTFPKHIQELRSRSKGKDRSSPLDLPSFNLLIPIMTKYLKDCDLSEIFPHLIDYAILGINSS